MHLAHQGACVATRSLQSHPLASPCCLLNAVAHAFKFQIGDLSLLMLVLHQFGIGSEHGIQMLKPEASMDLLNKSKLLWHPFWWRNKYVANERRGSPLLLRVATTQPGLA